MFNTLEQSVGNIYSRNTTPEAYLFERIKKGNPFPDFTLERRQAHFAPGFLPGNDAFIHYPEALSKPGKPLVWLFYTLSRYYPEEQVSFLKDLQADINVMKGELLIVSAAPLPYWKSVLPPQHTFNIYHDRENALSEQLGLIDHYNPVWKWMSGIDENTSFPCLLLASPDGKIKYSYIDSDFKMYNPVTAPEVYRRELLTSVYQAART